MGNGLANLTDYALVLVAREDLGDGTERRTYERPLDREAPPTAAARLRVTDFDVGPSP